MIPILRHKNQTLILDNTPLQEAAVAETYLTAETVGGSSSTLTVKNILGFAINQILLIEDLGSDNAEIVLTHASSAPSGSTVTLTGALVKTHPVGSKVRVIQYNQIEYKRGTTTVAADATALTVATTANFNPPSALGSGLVALDPTSKLQVHETSEHTSGYYFSRYKNSITSDFSGYTDAVVYGGWAKNTVGYMIDVSLRELSLTLSDKISKFDCYTWLTECLKEVEGKLIRWPDHYKFNYSLTTLTAGDNEYALPTDAYDTETNRSVLAIRVGSNGTPLTQLDPLEFEETLDGVTMTTAAEAGSVGETDIDLTSAADFPDAGTIYYFVSGTEYSFTYTGKSTNTLTGIPSSGTGSITEAFSSGDTMWTGIETGEPTMFTVRDGVIALYPMPADEEHGKALYIDYSTVANTIDSDGDTLDLHRADIAQPYLTWRIKCKARNDGVLDRNDGYYLSYKERLNDAIRTSPRTINFNTMPKVNTMRRQ